MRIILTDNKVSFGRALLQENIACQQLTGLYIEQVYHLTSLLPEGTQFKREGGVREG